MVKAQGKLEALEGHYRNLREEAQQWKEKAQKAEADLSQTRLSHEKLQAQSAQQLSRAQAESERWRDKYEDNIHELERLRNEKVSQSESLLETKLLLKSTEKELRALRGSSGASEELSQLRVERNFLEQQSEYLRDQLRDNKKLYENLVAALQRKCYL